LNRREFGILLGLGLSEKLIAAISLHQAEPTPKENYILTNYKKYVKQYPISSKNFSIEQQKFTFGKNEYTLNTKRFYFLNFDYHSQRPRFFMFDKDAKMEMMSLASHGIGSGNDTAFSFSNISQSYQSSLGIYVTGSHYVGQFGPSINLHGVCATNDNAFSRRIVMHGADYCGVEHIKKYGFLGRSLGCIALPKKNMTTAYQLTEPGTIIIVRQTPRAKPMEEKLISATAEEIKENRIP
jgi:hypothetical protein